MGAGRRRLETRSALGGWAAWLLGGLVPTRAHLAVPAVEIALSSVLDVTLGDVDPEEP